MKRPVEYARVHEMKMVIPGIGQLECVFPPQSKALPGLSMTWDGTTLELCIKGKYYGIPAANVQILTFSPENKVDSFCTMDKADHMSGTPKLNAA